MCSGGSQCQPTSDSFVVGYMNHGAWKVSQPVYNQDTRLRVRMR